MLKYGAQSIALASMDNYRIGAQEQLKTLGRILDVPVLQLDPSEPLSKSLASLARKRVILIDTAGLPASDPTLRTQLQALSDKGVKSKNYRYWRQPARARCSRRHGTTIVVAARLAVF